MRAYGWLGAKRTLDPPTMFTWILFRANNHCPSQVTALSLALLITADCVVYPNALYQLLEQLEGILIVELGDGLRLAYIGLGARERSVRKPEERFLPSEVTTMDTQVHANTHRLQGRANDDI